MSNLVNQHWITIDGEPVTGRIPPRLIVHGPELTEGQFGEVAHTYKLFCDATRVALGGYHVKNKVLSDGCRVRCTSISGVDTVQVWTVEGEEVQELWGVGIAFAADWGGTPFEKYRKLNKDTQVWEPQAVVLTPVARLNQTTGRYESTGKWRVTAVPKLLGGNKLWTAEDRKNWFSVFSPDWIVDPPGLVRSMHATPVYSTTTGYAPRFNEAWTPSSFDRMSVFYSSEFNEYLFDKEGRYAFRGNDTYVLTPYSGYQAPFVRKLENQAFLYWLYPNNTELVVHYRAYQRARKGLADSDIFEFAERDVIDEGSYTLPISTSFSAPTAPLSVSPSGAKACIAGTVSGNAKTHVVDITIGETVSLTIAPTDVEGASVTHSGTFSDTGSVYMDPEPTYINIKTACGGAWQLVLDQAPYVVGPGYENYGNYALTATGTRTLTDTHDYHNSTVTLNRAYYGHDGVLVLETLDQWVDLESEETLSATLGTNFVPGYDTEWTNTYTAQFSSTLTLSQTTADTIQLRARPFDVYNRTRSYTKTESLSTQFTGRNAVGGPMDSTRTFTQNVVGSSTTTHRQIVFYDERNDVVAFVETHVAFAFDETQGDTVTASGFTDTMAVPNMTLSPSFVVSPNVNTNRLVVQHRGVEVFAHPLPANPATTSTVSRPAKLPVSEVIMTEQSFINTEAGLVKIEASKQMTDHQTILLDCEPEDELGTNPAPVTINYYNRVLSQTTSYSNADPAPTTPISDFVQAFDKDRFLVQHARDPITLATVFNITYLDSPKRSWTFAVDDVSVKRVNEILGLPDVDVYLWQKYNANALVSI